MMDFDEPTPSSSNSRKRKRVDFEEDELSDDESNQNEDELDGEDGFSGSDEDNDNKFELGKVLRYQKSTTSARDGDIKMTPFNLKEELEMGEFDEGGNFVFKDSSEDEDKDAWAESVDWEAVEERKKAEDEKVKSSSVPNSSVIAKKFCEKAPTVVAPDQTTCYREMLRIMKSDETVQKTIRRLGNCVPRKRPIKSKSKETPDTHSTAEIAEFKMKLDRMIELAHQRLEDGDVEIYQKSYDDLEDAIN